MFVCMLFSAMYVCDKTLFSGLQPIHHLLVSPTSSIIAYFMALIYACVSTVPSGSIEFQNVSETLRS